MALYSWSAPTRRDYTAGMSQEDATELMALVSGLDAYMDRPDFIPKAAGYDALAIAKRDQDLFSLRHYSRMFTTGANVRDIVKAVATAKLFPNGGLTDLTVEQVETHAVVAQAIYGASGQAAKGIKRLALKYPGRGETIVELIADREIGDPEQIEAILTQTSEVGTPLHNGIL